jgi:CheY-like chemotaxis protein
MLFHIDLSAPIRDSTVILTRPFSILKSGIGIAANRVGGEGGAKQADQPELKPSTESTMSDDHVRVLIVDDDPAILEAITDWLQARCAAVVLAFRSAEEAMVAAEPGSFDVCILDYRLAGADGLTLGAMLREINPETQLILLSGELSAAVESLAFEHGFGRVFTKPVAPEALIDAIVD